MGEDYRVSLEKCMQDPEFKKEWDAIEPDYQIVDAICAVRKERNLSSADVARLTGLSPHSVNRLEMADGNPSLATLKKLANGLGLKLALQFTPLQ